MSRADGIVRADVVWPWGWADGPVRSLVCGARSRAGGRVWALMGWI